MRTPAFSTELPEMTADGITAPEDVARTSRGSSRSGAWVSRVPTGSLPVVFMFSGQGSQYCWMGKELFDENEVFRAALTRYDAAVAEDVGGSVLARIFDPTKRKNDPFSETGITHPAIVMIELALAETLQTAGIRPDYLLGSSLGEYTAAAVSGCIDPIDCLRLLIGQAAGLRAGPRGGMLAVLAEPEVLNRVPALRECEIAARNYPGHFIVAGTEEAVDRAESALRAADVLHQRVPVEYGYHSHLMDQVLAECRRVLQTVKFAPPRIPWVSSVDGTLVERASAEHFWQVARRPIEFELTMTRMRDRGEFLYLDLGPSGTLHNFVRNNLPPGTRSQSLPLLSPFGHDSDLLAKIHALAAPETRRRAHRMKVYGFPGQGSQQRGMGQGLFEKFPEQTAIADRVLGYSIEELCISDPKRQLGRTEFTQPALYVVDALSYLDRVARDPVPADYLIGHSLGEYVALFAAGAFDLETGLRLVQRRGELMAAAGGGGMAAVLGTDEATITRVLAESGLDGLDLANHNSVDQFVLSGPSEQIDAACIAFQAAGARAVRLNVSAPFHSRYMRGTAEKFAAFLEGFPLRPPTVPVLANFDAQPYAPDALERTLTAQIASPVLWTESVRRLMGHGDFEFVELGPGQVLTKLVARIRAVAKPLTAPSFRPEPAARAEAPVPVDAPSGPDERNGPAEPIPTNGRHRPLSSTLESQQFCDRYGVRRAYVAGGLQHGITSTALVTRMARAGLLSFLGSGGLDDPELANALDELRGQLGGDAPFGVSLLHGPADGREWARVQICLSRRIRVLEAIGFTRMTPALVLYRAKGLSELRGRVQIGHRIIARVSRPEAVHHFLSPAPEPIVKRLLADGHITDGEASLLARVPMADDLCAQADSGGITDHGLAYAVIPALDAARGTYRRKHGYSEPIGLGAAGGLGAPEAVAAAFILGAEFVVTGTINQCTVEANTSDAVKDMLDGADIQDTDYAPAADAFELGGKVQVLKRGVFFPARANRLYRLYLQHDHLDDLDGRAAKEIQDTYLRCSFEQAIERARSRFSPDGDLPPPSEPNAKRLMALAFRWYLERATLFAIEGLPGEHVNYQVPCSPAVGAMNRWTRGTQIQGWRGRHVDELGIRLLDEATDHLRRRTKALVHV
jgi:trans-AT polyketide synthase/acyltransferase/oxidoreductase domain-containing protein